VWARGIAYTARDLVVKKQLNNIGVALLIGGWTLRGAVSREGCVDSERRDSGNGRENVQSSAVLSPSSFAHRGIAWTLTNADIRDFFSFNNKKYV